MREGPELLQLRVKYLIKENSVDMAALLAKACADFHEFGGSRGHFKQSYLVCVCSSAPQEMLMEEVGGTAEPSQHRMFLINYFLLQLHQIRFVLNPTGFFVWDLLH